MLTLLWFSRDLRLTDNPALAAAIARGGPIVPVFVLDDPDAGKWAPGGASRWWLLCCGVLRRHTWRENLTGTQKQTSSGSI